MARVLFDVLSTRQQAEGVARNLRQRFSPACTTAVRKYRRGGRVAVYVNDSCRVFAAMGRSPAYHATLVAARTSNLRGAQRRKRRR